jgi:hypothetical protein
MSDKMAERLGASEIEPPSVKVKNYRIFPAAHGICPEPLNSANRACLERYVAARQNVLHYGIESCARVDAAELALAGASYSSHRADGYRVFPVKRVR